jgi:hypothetical protein
MNNKSLQNCTKKNAPRVLFPARTALFIAPTYSPQKALHQALANKVVFELSLT